jgi:hypothetical protein
MTMGKTGQLMPVSNRTRTHAQTKLYPPSFVVCFMYDLLALAVTSLYALVCFTSVTIAVCMRKFEQFKGSMNYHSLG